MAKQKKTTKTKKRTSRQKSAINFPWKYLIGVFGLAIMLYANTLNHGFVLDDDLVCVKNDYVQKGWGGLPDIFTSSWYEGFNGEKDPYYRPMMLAAFAVEKGLFGHSAQVYHAMNILWYALTVVMLFLLLRQLFPDSSLQMALAITLLFVVHPIHTEVVANIKSRDEIFALLGLVTMLYGAMRYEQVADDRRWLILSLAGFFFALLSKESSLAFLALIPLTLYFFTDTNKLPAIGYKTIPYAILAGVFLLIRFNIVSSADTTFNPIDNALFAADGLGQQTATAVAMMGKYVGLLFFPHPLIYDYSYAQIPLVSWGAWQAWLGLIVIVAALGYAITVWQEKNKLAYAIGFFAITSVITSNLFFLIGATFAERFMFVPSLAFCIFIVMVLQKGLIYLQRESWWWGVLGLILLAFSVKTFTQNAVWESNSTLFSHGILVAPNSARVNAYYGKALYDQALTIQDNNQKTQRLTEAETYFERAIEILPGYTQAYQNLGLVLEEQQAFDKALANYQRGIKTEPDYYPLHTNAGVLLYNQKRYGDALPFLQEAVNLGPNDPRNHHALGLVLHQLKKYEAAIEAYKRAHELQPTHIPYLGNLVTIHRELNQIETAIFYDKQIKALQGK